MRKLHCLLMGMPLPVGHGLFAQSTEALAPKLSSFKFAFIALTSIRGSAIFLRGAYKFRV